MFRRTLLARRPLVFLRIRRALLVVVAVLRILRLAIVVGLATATVGYPVYAGVGFAVKLGANGYTGMPSDLTVTPPPQTSYLYAGDGTTLITSFYEENRQYAPLTAMSPLIQQAIVAAEDSRFFQHHGVDLKGTLRAFVANQHAGAVAQGASTLTMQFVRNELRDSAGTPQESVDATAQSPARKLREMKLAVNLERKMSKAQILEGYLNIAYFGHRAYGISAAADVYFSTSPAQLTLPEAAMIAGLVQAPTTYDPASSDQKAAIQRRNYVIDRMVELDYVSAGEAAAAKAAPIALHLHNPPNDCNDVPDAHLDWGFFCDEFKQWWASQPAFGANPRDRMEDLRRGGYRIVASIDPAVQAIAMAQTLKRAPVTDRYALGSVFVEPGTGLIKAMAINRVYSLDLSDNLVSTDPDRRAQGLPGNYPNTVGMLLGGGENGGYQAGSTFKYFTMLAALEAGMSLNTTIYSPMRVVTHYVTGGGPASCGTLYCPSNASGAMTGNQTMWSGWGKSVNTYWVQVEERVGADKAVAMAERLGLTWHNDVDRNLATPQHAAGWGPFTLGVADTTPLEMAAAYATVAADGRFCAPLPVRSITGTDGKPLMAEGPDGRPVEAAAPQCKQAVSADVARGAVDAMRCTTGDRPSAGSCGGWSTAPGAMAAVGRPFAGKTGTTDSTRAAWFAGFTPQLSGASFVADPDNPNDAPGDGQSNKPIDAVTLTIHDALTGRPVVGFTPPPAYIVGS
jgi:membrane peptidoglycan carboxypeptidase